VNRDDVSHNYTVARDSNGKVSVQRLERVSDMLDVSFKLLGNSVSDLFFPENFLIVEGASDQVILESVQRLLEIDSSTVKVFSATSLERIAGVEEAIRTTLRPLVAEYSPYHQSVVCLVDGENDANRKLIRQLRSDLGDRLVQLESPSLEEYLTSELYLLARRDRAADLKGIELARQTGDYRKEAALKEEISNQIAAILSKEHLPRLGRIVEALKRAAGL